MPLTLFDSHCHFDFEVFDEMRVSLWGQCQKSHIAGLIMPGIKQTQWLVAQDLAHNYSGSFFSVGLHPWFIQYEDDVLEEASRALSDTGTFLADDLCVAVGECGLDTNIDVPMPTQVHLLEQHIELANEFGLPLILHCVKAHATLLETLKRHPLTNGGVIHAFSGSPEVAKRYIDQGLYLGIGGTITYERAQKTRRAAKQMPLEHLLLETDAPSMPLSGKQGETNSPLYLPEVARTLAALRDEPIEHIANTTTDSAYRLFGINHAKQEK